VLSTLCSTFCGRRVHGVCYRDFPKRSTVQRYFYAWQAQVHSADIQDRDGAPDLLASIRYLFPWLRHVFADGANAGEKLETALAGRGQWTLEIVKRSVAISGDGL
jgi:hypothetical protein